MSYQVQQSPDGGHTWFVQNRIDPKTGQYIGTIETFTDAERYISDIEIGNALKRGWSLRIVRVELMRERVRESEPAVQYREYETLDICAADGFLTFDDAASVAILNRLENFGVIMNGPKYYVPTESRNYRICFPLQTPMTYFSDPR